MVQNDWNIFGTSKLSKYDQIVCVPFGSLILTHEPYLFTIFDPSVVPFVGVCSFFSTDLPDVGSLGAGSAKGLWATCAQTTKAGRWPVIFSVGFRIQCLFAKYLCFALPAKIHVQNVALSLFNMTSDAGCWCQSPWDGFEFASALDSRPFWSLCTFRRGADVSVRPIVEMLPKCLPFNKARFSWPDPTTRRGWNSCKCLLKCLVP